MEQKLVYFIAGFAVAVALARIDATKGYITGGNKFFG